MGTGVMIGPFYVCAYVPEFPAQALLRLRPELTQTPVVVLSGDPPLEQVCSFNSQARKLGIERTMTRAELDAFAGLCVLRQSHTEERAASAALLEAAGAFTPRVEIQPASSSAFAMVLDMAGTQRLLGSPSQSISAIRRALKTMHFYTQFAASTNFLTAVCLAPFSKRTPAIVMAGQEQHHLASLPLSALHLTPQQEETLSLWGLHTVGELAELPEVELIVRLGQEGKRLHLMARGEHPHLMVPEEPEFVLVEFIALDAPIELLDSLLFVLSPMLEQLLTRAQSRALALASVTVTMGLDGGSKHERTIKPALPVTQKEVLLKLLHLDLQSHPPTAGVLSVRVQAEPGDRSKAQLGLFVPPLPEPTRLEITLSRIAGLVGEDRVGYAVLTDTHKPDSFRMQRFAVPSTVPKTERIPTATAVLRQCRPPLPVVVKQRGKRLLSFRFRGKHYIVQEAYGPWRRSGEWWSAEVWSHEEWDVHATAAQESLLCVLMQDLLHQQWQMKALYD